MKLFLFTILVLAPTFCLAQDAVDSLLQKEEEPTLSETGICFNSKCCIINKQYICPLPPKSGGRGVNIHEAPDDPNAILERLNEKMLLEQLGVQS